jgi:hypothetical protein
MGIMQGLRKKERGNSHGGAATSAARAQRKLPEPSAPLMMMLPDAAGIAAYQLNDFHSPKAAEFFIDSSLRGKMPEGAVMFWALNWEPRGMAEAEPLVLIRDGENVVYPFSFSDLESAFEFVRHEMHRGLHLFQVMIYWAVPARVEADFWGRSTIVPSEAPRRGMSVVQPSAKGEAANGSVSVVAAAPQMPQIEAPASDDDSERFLQDDDIADAVRQANHIATHTAPELPETNGNIVTMPAPAPSSRKSKNHPAPVEADPIDFASASQKVGESRATRAAINAWSNFTQAVDEALDVYVARQVATKLAWNRISRALGHAMEAKQQFDLEEGVRKAQEAAMRAEAARQEAARATAVEAARLEEERLAAARAAAAEAARVAAAVKAAKLRGLVFGWQNGSYALANSVQIVQHNAMVRRSWATGTVELARAAKVVGKRKAMRKAWLNAAWTLEEAGYAYVLEQKSRAIRAWRAGSVAIAEAATARIAYETSMRTVWSNAGNAIGQAHRAHVTHLHMLERSWATGSKQIRIAVLTRQRMIRVRTGLNNFSIALEEAIEAKAYRDEMMEVWDAAIDGLLSAADAREYCEMMSAAWGNVAFALEGVCRAYVRKQKRAIRAWGRLAKAFGSAFDAKVKQDAAIEAWLNISFALEDAVYAKRRHLGLVSAWRTGSAVLSDSARRKYRGLVFAWTSASAVVAEAVVARKSYEAAVLAWTNASIALEEATVACARYWAFVDAWENAGDAMREAVEAYLAWKAGLESAWEALTFAFEDAVQAMIFRDQSIAAWSNAMLGIGEMVHAFVVQRMLIRFWGNAGLAIAEAVPAHLFKEQSIAGWQTASLAFRQVVVAEAKLRIAAARLDRKQMAAVDKLVKAATARAPRSRKSRADDAFGEPEVAPEPFVPALAMRHVTLPEEFLPDDFDDELDDLSDLVTTEDDSASIKMFEDDAPTDDDKEKTVETKKAPLFPGLWRSHDASRWKPSEEPFNGFKSPPGRF